MSQLSPCNDSHSWSTTTIGLWLKYPNPHSGHVLTVDVLSRSVDVDTGVLRTERLLGVKQAIPVGRSRRQKARSAKLINSILCWSCDPFAVEMDHESKCGI